MNGINVKAILSILCALGLGIYVMVEVILARSSSLGQLYLFMAIGAFLFGTTNPKRAIYVLIVASAYIDVLKRLMVVGGNPTLLDVAYINSIPPLLVTGSVISVFLALLLGKEPMTKERLLSLIVSAAVVLVTVVGTIGAEDGGQGLSRLSGIVNQGFYAFLFFIIPVLFPTDEERRKLLHFSFVVFIPSVFYMFWQRKFGYADFEYRYLLTGLTIEVKNLAESFGQVRCFSTFNGAGTASTLLSIYILYCFVPLRRGNTNPTFFQRFGKWSLAPLFAIASYFTIVRTGWVSGVVTIVAYLLLGSKLRCRFGLFVAIGGYATVILTAPLMLRLHTLQWIETNLQEIVVAATSDPTLKRAIVMGTAEDRIRGWANLTEEPKLWQPFGFSVGGMKMDASNQNFHWGHDALIDALIKFGYVPLVLGLCLAAFMMSRLLKYMFSLPRQSLPFKITRLCLALNAGILIGAMSSGAQFRNFPQNLYFALWFAIPFATYQQAIRERKLQQQRLQPGDAEKGDSPSVSPPGSGGVRHPNPA